MINFPSNLGFLDESRRFVTRVIFSLMMEVLMLISDLLITRPATISHGAPAFVCLAAWIIIGHFQVLDWYTQYVTYNQRQHASLNLTTFFHESPQVLFIYL